MHVLFFNGFTSPLCFYVPCRMPYTEAVIHEVLRKSSLASVGVQHMSTKDTVLANYTIPKVSHFTHSLPINKVLVIKRKYVLALLIIPSSSTDYSTGNAYHSLEGGGS